PTCFSCHAPCSLLHLLFTPSFSRLRRPPTSAFFPYTTLFRSSRGFFSRRRFAEQRLRNRPARGSSGSSCCAAVPRPDSRRRDICRSPPRARLSCKRAAL